MITPTSAVRQNVQNEINFALSHNIPFLAIHLRKTDLPPEMDLQIGTKHAILKYNMSEEEYNYKYITAFERLGIKRKRTAKKSDAVTQSAAFAPQPVRPAPAPHSPAPQAVQQTAPVSSQEEHRWGSYKPDGTAIIKTTDGREFTAVANSLVLKATGIEPSSMGFRLYNGLDSVSRIRNYHAENLIPFSDMLSVERAEDALIVTDSEGETRITLDLRDELWFIGEKDGFMPTRIEAGTIRSIAFDREHTPAVDICFCRIRKKDGTLLSPVSFLWFKDSISKTGVPFDDYFKDLTSYADAPVSFRQIKKITVTENGTNGSAFEPPKPLRLAVTLKKGDRVDVPIKSYRFFIAAMTRHGLIKYLSNETLQEIEFLSTDVSEAPEPVKAQTPAPQPEKTAPKTKASGIKAPQTPALTGPEHKWGSYEPKGVAHIKTADGSEITAVANSLVLYSADINGHRRPYFFEGLKPLDKDGQEQGEFIYFSDMISVRKHGERIDVTDVDEDETSIEPHPDAELWFIGEKDGYMPATVKLGDVEELTFDRSITPDVAIRYCRVTTEEGSFLSPYAFLWFHYNTGIGIPSMRFTKDLSKISPAPLSFKRLKKLTVTKNGREGTTFSASEDMEMDALLKNGETLHLVISGRYDSFHVMSGHGMMRRLSRNNLKEIEIL